MSASRHTSGRCALRLPALVLLFLLTAIPSWAQTRNAALDSLSKNGAAIAINSDSSVLFERNSSAKLPPASTTKLVTAMVAIDMLSPDTIVTVSRHAACTPSVSPHLRPGETFTVEDLLHIALIRSVNSAAIALAEAAAGSEDEFAKLMNAKVKKIGAVDTKFVNASGLPDEGIQYTTVYDLTLILKEALKYPLIKEIIGKKDMRVYSQEGRALYVQSTDRMLWASDKLIGGKTGYTRAARHCFVGAIETDDGLLYTAVLGARSRGVLWASTGALMGLSGKPLPEEAGNDDRADAPKPVKRAVRSHPKAAPVKAVSRAAAGSARAKQYAAAAKLRSAAARKRSETARLKARQAAAASKKLRPAPTAAKQPATSAAADKTKDTPVAASD